MFPPKTSCFLWPLHGSGHCFCIGSYSLEAPENEWMELAFEAVSLLER